MLIKELTLFSPNIKEQAHFYGEIIGLKVKEFDAHSLLVHFGKSKITFRYRANTTPYHFAINIPANKELEALMWLKSRVEILTDGGQEIQNFSAWNAKAVYFYDGDKNIVELIARKNLDNSTEQKFDTNQFLEISEIGIPTSDLKRTFLQIQNFTNQKIYDGSLDRFCAIGNERGLFICIDKNKKDWFPTNDKAFSSDFEIVLIEQGKEYHLVIFDEQVELAK